MVGPEGFIAPPRARNHCRHYSYRGGLTGGPQCARGVDLGGNPTFMGEPSVRRTEKCMPDPKDACALREEWTQEERDRWDVWVKERVARMILINAALPERKPSTSGSIPCPACQTGTVYYEVARNKHRHAQCTTPGCFHVME